MRLLTDAARYHREVAEAREKAAREASRRR